MTPIATLKTDPTPELITKILTRAAADGADALVIHLSQTSEDEICFLYLLVPKLSPRPEELERSHLPPSTFSSTPTSILTTAHTTSS